jgi:hypothetical protein
MWTSSYIGDKYHIRGPIIIFNSCLAILGLGLTGFLQGNAVRYFGVFLVAGATNSNIPTVMAYQANNIRGQWKRALCSATLVAFGGIGGIAGSLVFRTQDVPKYFPGIYATMALVPPLPLLLIQRCSADLRFSCNALAIVMVLFLSVYFAVQNKLARRGLAIIEGKEGFMYTL